MSDISLLHAMREFIDAIYAGFRYSVYMARGWESKSAEEQVERKTEERADAAKGDLKTKMTAADAVHARARQLLELKRERILSEKTSHPARRAALQAALQAIESELQQID